MTSIITAWLVKLATRILRDQLTDKEDRIDRLENRLAFRERCLRDTEVAWKNEAELAHSRGVQLADSLGRIESLSNRCDALRGRIGDLDTENENLRTENDVLRRQLDNQAATIREYQAEKENLLCTIDTLQANVSGWSRLFATIEHQVGVSKQTADRLREERDRFTLRTPSTTESREDDAPSGRVEASDFLNSIKPGDSLRITDKAKVYFGNDREWFVVREVCNGYHPDIPRFRVDGPKGDWHPFWFGLTDEDGLYLLPGAKERVNVVTVQSPSTTGAGSASKASDLFTGSKFDGTTDIG